MKTEYIQKFIKQRILFAFLSTALYFGFYKHVVIRRDEFKVSGGLSFLLAILLWRLLMDNRAAKVSRIIAFSVLFGVIQFLLTFTTITIHQLPNLSVIFTQTILSFFAHQYILTGVTGITKSILMCMIATYAVKLSWAFSQKKIQSGNYEGQEIQIRYDFRDRFDVTSGDSVLFQQKQRILFSRNFQFNFPKNEQIIDGMVTIKKHFFNCKTSIKMSVNQTPIRLVYYDWFEGLNLLDLCAATIAFIASFISLTVILKPFAPKPTTEANEFLLCALILTQNIASCCFAAFATNIFNKFNRAYFTKQQTNKCNIAEFE